MELIVLRADALFQIHLPGLQFTHYPLCGWIPRRIQVNYLAEGNAVLSPVRVEPVTSGLPAASLRTCKMNQSEMESVRAKESYRKSLREQEKKRECVSQRETVRVCLQQEIYSAMHCALRAQAGLWANKQACAVLQRQRPDTSVRANILRAGQRKRERQNDLFILFPISPLSQRKIPDALCTCHPVVILDSDKRNRLLLESWAESNE